MTIATALGLVSTLLFASSTLPMLARALRTRDLSSYSRSHLVLTNVGNLVHTGYVVSLAPGPIWGLHAFHTAVAAQMLLWHLRHAHRARQRPQSVAPPAAPSGRSASASSRAA